MPPSVFFSLFLLAGGAAAASDADAALLAALRPAMVEARLDNGLRVVIVEDHRAPVIALHLQSPAGAADDLHPPLGEARPGLAHLVEHLSFAGSPRAPAGAYDRLLSAAGVENNAWTEHDGMALHLVGPVEALDLALFLEADRMAGLDPGSVAARLPVELEVVERERAIDRDSPGGRDLVALRAALYPPDHPDHHAVEGLREGLDGVGVEELLAFHAAAWTPSEAVLVLIGDLDAQAALARIRAAFGPIPARPGFSRLAAPLPAPQGGSAHFVDDVEATSLYAAWPGPAAGHADSAALELLVELLATPDQGRLQDLVRRGRALRAEAFFSQDRRGGRIVLDLAAEGVGVGGLRRRLERVLTRLAAQPPDAEELALLHARWRGFAARALQDPEAMAEVLATCVIEEGRPDCFADHVARHLAVDAEQVLEAARTWLRPEDRLWLSVGGPGAAALPGARRIQLEGPSDRPDPDPAQASEATDPALPSPALPVPPAPAPWLPPVPTVHHLANGTPVWILERPEVSLVRVGLSLRRGVLQAEAPLALVHAGALLDEGSGGLDAEGMQRALSLQGAELRLGVGMARAWAELEVLPGREAAGLDLLRQAILEPSFPRARLRPARRSAAKDAARAWTLPGTLHATALLRACYPPEHPLARRFRPAEHRRIGRGDLRRAWAEELALGAPAIVVVGRTRPEEILPLLEQSLGDLPAGGQAPSPIPHLAPARPGPRSLLVDLPGAERALVSLALPMPGADDPALPGIERIHRALSAEFDSRLSRLLREQRGWTYAVDGLLRVWPGHGLMEIRFAVDPAVLPMAMAAVEAELRRFLAEPPGPEERSAALLSLRREASLRQLRLERAVDQLTVAQAWGQGPEAERLLLASAEALDPAALQALAAAWIQPEALIWVISGDRARIEPLLEAAGRTPDAIRGGPAIMDGEPPLPL